AKQFGAMLELENVKLHFTDDALVAIAEKAKKAGTGARALRMILENLMRDLMFEIPSDPTVSEVTIDKDSVLKIKQPEIKRHDQKIA
ncbi:MAG: ATP-dependent Clp protease ATP-binding subunit ClpX, partial [Waddliaceae bacterium]